MNNEYLDADGSVVSVSSLRIPRAKALADIVSSGRLNFVRFIECRRTEASEDGEEKETVVFEVDVERPQKLEAGILKSERIAVGFSPKDNWYPEIQARRKDFPQVPHLNLRPQELPRSLCLYNQTWEQVALTWTPKSCVDTIRWWLAETAKGTLHQEDQRIEPFFFETPIKLVLPPGLFDGNGDVEPLELNFKLPFDSKESRVLLVDQGDTEHESRFLALSFAANPQSHQTIRHCPKRFKDLVDFLQTLEINFLDRLRTKFQGWNTKQLREKKLIIIVSVPRTRDSSRRAETRETWAFLVDRTVEQLGIEIGIWQKTPGSSDLGFMMTYDPRSDDCEIPVIMLSTQEALTREIAALSSGFRSDLRRIVAVGVGALGSQVVDSLFRGGFGTWTLIDEDVLLPHNIIRHALNGMATGFPKAQFLSYHLDSVFRDLDGSDWIGANVLYPGEYSERLLKAFKSADLILDMAASVPVSRYLVHELKPTARMISLFLNPRGSDLVVLAEDQNRHIPLDCLEVQYYRSLTRTEDLRTHLSLRPGQLRYSQSCRDVSSIMPNDLVSLHSAIGSRAVRDISQIEEPQIRIWRADPSTFNVSSVTIPVSPISVKQIGEWTLVLDDELLTRLATLRTSRLPNETGGVLIGNVDLRRRIIYVVDSIPSPPDSCEWPTLYIRGCAGLPEKVEQIGQITNGQLMYIGEWHSHPDGCSCLPSNDDLQVFSWLTENLSLDSLPALMAIVGGGGETMWFLGKMVKKGGWSIGKPGKKSTSKSPRVRRKNQPA